MLNDKKLRKIKNLPSPKGHFLLGHLPQFNTPNKHQVLERWVEECGDIFKVNFIGKEFIVSADIAFNNQVLKLRPGKFRRLAKMDEILTEIGVVGVFNAEGDTWKRHRKLTSEALNPKKVRAFYPDIKDKAEKLLKKWKQYVQEGQVVDVQKEFMRFTVDVTTAIAFGYEMDTINNKDNGFQKHLEHIFPMINERITTPFPLWRYIKRKKDKTLEKSIKAIEQIIYRFIDEAKKRLENNPQLKENPSNFLEALLAEGEKDIFSDEEIYGNIFTMLLAGEDTTSNSISWAVFYLCQNPDIVKKVRQEAFAVYENDPVPSTTRLLLKLKYANSVALEALRLKPTAPVLYIEAIEDIVIEELLVPKDTKIILQNKVAQTRQRYFSNPDAFIPERWLGEECPRHKNHHPEVMRTFGGGTRFCPGKNLAMNEMTALISTLCKHFDFSMSVKPEAVKEQFSFTMYPENLLVKPEYAG